MTIMIRGFLSLLLQPVNVAFDSASASISRANSKMGGTSKNAVWALSLDVVE